MSIPRFFCDTSLDGVTELALPAQVAHHIRVRRLKAGQSMTLFDGSGLEFEATLTFTPAGQAIATIHAQQTISRELGGRIRLLQGLTSQDKMDWIIEKAVELGVSHVLPTTANRSVTKLDQSRSQKRLEHWKRLIISASEQCGRNQLMIIDPARPLSDALRHCANSTLLLLDADPSQARLELQALLPRLRASADISILVGPEGGWDKTEADLATSCGAIRTSLGSRVLRTETAGLSAVSAITALLAW